MMIDLVQLRTFVAVAEEQHLTRAAERLFISLSAASAHIKSVETSLDAQLFIRNNRGLELTRTGQLLLIRAKDLLSEATLFTSFARELNGRMEGRLIVASGSDPSSGKVGHIIGALRDSHPLVTVDLRARPSSETREGLMTGELDVGLLQGRSIENQFDYYELMNIPLCLAGPAVWKHEIEEAGWSQLASLPWIIPTESSKAYTAILNELFRDRGIELNCVVRFDNAMLGRDMLEAGVGMMLVREDYAKLAEQRGALAISPLAKVDYTSYMAHLSSRKHDPLICAFIEATTKVWPEIRKLDPA